MTAVLRPGEKYPLNYSGGVVQAKAFNGTNSEELASLMDEAIDYEETESLVGMVQAAKKCLAYVVGETEAERLWAGEDNAVNAAQALEIAHLALRATRLEAEEIKN